MCKFCNTSVSALYPDKKHCVLHMVGMCGKSDCGCNHTVASAEEAMHILTLLEKAIANPDKLKATQGK
eukprot:14802908-Ditylum_brightwellii.AAC.1